MKVTSQKGAGLVEILVSLVILSIGLLGIASLQATGIQAGQGASLRTSALIVTEDIVSRMKANQVGVYNVATAIESYNSGVADAGVDNGCNDSIGGAAGGCNAAQMARHDVFMWKQNLNATLPASATGEVVTAVLVAPVFPIIDALVMVTVTIEWQEKGETKSIVSQLTIKVYG